MRKTLLALSLFLGACSYPAPVTQQGGSPGQLYFPDAPPGAIVIIDGVGMGPASSFDGRQVIEVKSGTHRIVLTTNGTPILDKRYYVDAGAKVAVRNE